MQSMNMRGFAAAPCATPCPDRGQAQREHWEKQLAARPQMFGAEASAPAHYLRGLLEQGRVGEGQPGSPHAQERPEPQELLELGAGQGRDTLYFAAAGLKVLALDYAEAGLQAVEAAARAARVTVGRMESQSAGQQTAARPQIRVLQHDVRQPLPLADASVDACYAHMLLCMALTMDELRALCAELRRVLRPGGLVVYTVRHEGDPHHGAGTHGGENMYETGGFMVHFFNNAMVDTLAQGFTLRDVLAFEEGELPRRLWRVTMEKAE